MVKLQVYPIKIKYLPKGSVLVYYSVFKCGANSRTDIG